MYEVEGHEERSATIDDDVAGRVAVDAVFKAIDFEDMREAQDNRATYQHRYAPDHNKAGERGSPGFFRAFGPQILGYEYTNPYGDHLVHELDEKGKLVHRAQGGGGFFAVGLEHELVHSDQRGSYQVFEEYWYDQ